MLIKRKKCKKNNFIKSTMRNRMNFQIPLINLFSPMYAKVLKRNWFGITRLIRQLEHVGSWDGKAFNIIVLSLMVTHGPKKRRNLNCKLYSTFLRMPHQIRNVIDIVCGISLFCHFGPYSLVYRSPFRSVYETPRTDRKQSNEVNAWMNASLKLRKPDCHP